jgi:D-galactarolactone cycloisomerase
MRIADVEAFAIRAPFTESAYWGAQSWGEPAGLSAVSAAAYARWQPSYSDSAESTLVRIRSDTGLTGWGEAKAPVAPEICRDLIHSLLRPILIGADPMSVVPLWERLYGAMALRNHGAGFMLEALSAVDIALWDLAGRSVNLPVYALLGGAFRQRIPLYASGVVGLQTDEDRDARVVNAARGFANAGFVGVKVALGHGVERDLKSLRLVREAIGDRLLLGDVAGRYDIPQARRLIRHLDDLGLFLLEAPLPAELRNGYQVLGSASATPISNDLLGARWDWADLLMRNAVSIVQPDVSRAGGLTECRRIAVIAESFGASCIPHMSISSVVHQAACAHFAATLPHVTVMEYWAGSSPLSDGGIGAGIRVDEGHMVVPSGPGLGIEIDADLVLSFVI